MPDEKPEQKAAREWREGVGARIAAEQAREREREAREREEIAARWRRPGLPLEEGTVEEIARRRYGPQLAGAQAADYALYKQGLARPEDYGAAVERYVDIGIRSGYYTIEQANAILEQAEMALNSEDLLYAKSDKAYSVAFKNLPLYGELAFSWKTGPSTRALLQTVGLEQTQFAAERGEHDIATKGVTQLESMMRSGAPPAAVREVKNRFKTELSQYYMKNPEMSRGWADDWNRAGKVIFDLSSLELREYGQDPAFPSEKGAKAQQWFQEKFPSIAGDRGGARPVESWRDIISGSGRFAPKIRTISD